MYFNIDRNELYRYILRQLAMDVGTDLKEGQWLTNKDGQHYHVDKDGKIDAGMGGKFNGTHVGDIEEEEQDEEEKKRYTRAERQRAVERWEEGGFIALPKESGELPEHIRKLKKIPPEWADVHINPDPDAPCAVRGFDRKGREQRVYNRWYEQQQQGVKLERVFELDEKINNGDFEKHLDRLRQGTRRERDTADCLMLIEKMGLRPGSERDTKADVQAYGATTLRGEHVILEGNHIIIRFIGKKGVSIELSVPDGLASMMRERKEKAGDSGQLFSCNEKNLRDVMKKFGAKTKDLRTRVAMVKACEFLADKPPPKNDREYRKKRLECARYVSGFLGNTPTVALSSYIPPSIFSDWKNKALAEDSDIRRRNRMATKKASLDAGKEEFDRAFEKYMAIYREGREPTYEEEMDFDAAGGYFPEYDEEGNRIDDW